MRTPQEKYQAERDKLILQAEHYADKHCGVSYNASGAKFKDRKAWNAGWNLAYHTQMNKLAKNITI